MPQSSSTLRTIAVYCGSSPGGNPVYNEAVKRLADELVGRGLRTVYGGALVGAMGVLADRVLQQGGQIVGVLTQRLYDYEIAHPGLTELHVTDTMHERKQMMADLADGFIALPGGLGTLDEFVEVVGWGQLGLHKKPTGMLNTLGYFDNLLAFLDHAVDERFLRRQNRDAVLQSDDPVRLLDSMAQWDGGQLSKWMDAEGNALDIGAKR